MHKAKPILFSLIILIFFTLFLYSKYKNNTTQPDTDSLNKQIQTFLDNQKQIETNKKLIADFYQELFGDKNINSINKYIGDIYIQHNPDVADGKEALKQAVTQWFNKGASKEKIDIQHIHGEGSFVYIHTKSITEAVTLSVIDIFRLENGKIVEHWDVIQQVPEKSANSHPMF